MIHLNLTDDINGRNSEYEFYLEGAPAKFLSDIKNINLVVGANNSRKSRFLRSVLALEQKFLVHSDIDLNTFYHDGLLLVEEVKKLMTNSLGHDLVFMRIYAPENALGKILVSFFDEIGDHRRIINSGNLSKLIEDIIDLATMLSNKQALDRLKEKTQQLETACGLILYLYRHLQSNGNRLAHVASYPNGPFRHMEPLVPNVQPQGIVPFVDEIITTIQTVEKWIKKLGTLQFEVHKGNYIYIPVLRTSRSLEGVGSNDIFHNTIIKQHFNDKLPHNVNLDTGLMLYEKISYAKNGNTSERNAFAEFEDFIGLTFFKSKDICIVAHIDRSKSRIIKITVPGQKEDVPIYDLGDGVQGIINLLFPIFTAKQGDWIFIDEPENHLHPGYQNIFMRAISDNDFIRKKQLKFFINTHSNHILSEAFLSSSNVGIFIFNNRDSKSSSIYAFDQDHYRTLELLGVMNTSVFVTNCTVWVEGITDRFYLRAFLYAYCQSLEDALYRPNEGFDFSFVEYAGKNLVHYDFDGKGGDNIASYFLNANVFLLADSDFDEEKHKKYEKIKRSNFRYRQTEVPEIENLLPVDILKSFLIEELGCDITSVENLVKTIGKKKLGKAFNGVTRNGKILQIEAKSGGTLSSSYKSRLSKYVYDNILNGNISWKDLESSTLLANIITDLYKFIKSKNGKS